MMASVERRHQLGKDAPDILFLSKLIFLGQLLDDPAQVTATTILHVEVQFLTRSQVVAMVVCDDVGMAERTQNGKLGMKLLPLLQGHFHVLDFLSAEDLGLSIHARGMLCGDADLAIRYSLDFGNDSK